MTIKLQAFFILIISVINIINVKAKNEIEIGLLEQSMLYGIATASKNIESDNNKCDSDFDEFLNAVNLRKTWALEMLDASGQEEYGYLTSNYLWMGSWHLCQNIDSLHAPYDVNFMSILFKHNNTMQLQLSIYSNEYLQIGLCVPKSCSIPDIHKKVNKVLLEKQLNYLANYPLELSILKMKSLDYETNTWADNSVVTITIIIFAVTLFLSISGSLYDEWIRQPHLKIIEEQKKINNNTKSPKKMFGENTLWSKILLCYSIPSNIKSLFDTNMKAADSLPAIHGLKSFGMFYIVLLHFPLYNSMTMQNALMVIRKSATWYYQICFKSAHSVDTFFCIGGFLMSYIFFKTQKDKKPYNFPQGVKIFIQMMLHRIIRLVPAYLVTISLVVTIWRWLESSFPMFRLVDAADEICPKYWWRNFLFITTWFPRSEMCITWTWYISEDIQLYMLNCILLIAANKYLKPVIYTTKLLVIYSIIYTAWISYSTHYIPSFSAPLFVEIMYYSFSIRMAPYFVGVVAGYYFQSWGGKLPLSDSGFRIGWLLFIIDALFVIQGLPYPNQTAFWYNVVHNALSRTLWGVGISWMLMACLSGYGGIINKMLSFRGWIPFSRTTFSVYLTNLIIVNMYGYTGSEAMYLVENHEIFYSVGNIIFCFFVGLLFSILFESPFVQIFKLLMTSGNKKKSLQNDSIKSIEN